MSDPDVVVIGGGFAGLSAAARLAPSRKVIVLEARSRLGGRATAFADRQSGELVDNGQHVLLGCYSDTLDFLSRVDALGNVHMETRLRVAMIDRRGRWSELTCPDLPSPWHLLAGIFEWDALDWRDRAAALRMAAPLRIARRSLEGRTSRQAASPGETVDQWLIRNGQTPRLRELLWDPLALAALNQPPSAAAAPPFARVLAEMFGADARAASIILPSRPLHEMYAEPARAFIERHGGIVRTGAPARIVIRNGVLDSVTCGGERWAPDAVISAVPWFALPDVFEGETPGIRETLNAARNSAESPIVTVNLWFDRVVLADRFVGLPGRTMQWVFDKRVMFGDGASHLSLVSSGAAAVVALTNEELVATALQEIVDAMPAARSARVKGSSVVREPRATFSLAPGQPARPPSLTDVAGLYLAGDWIETGLPATIESACRSGHAAARLILSRDERDRRPL